MTDYPVTQFSVAGHTVAQHIEALRAHGDRLAVAAERAGVATTVPTCPRWHVGDLIRHVGMVHRWAAGTVTRAKPTDEQVRATAADPGDDELPAWFRAGHTALLDALSTADPATKCMTFLPAPSPIEFWARRQAHETAIHRVDAESATGHVTPFSPAFAADGLSELIEGFMGRRGGSLKADPPVSLAIEAVDIDAAWTVRIEAAGRTVVRGRQSADAAVVGTASDLYLLLWNRAGRDTVRVDGDGKVLDIWRYRAKIRWR